MCKDNAFLLFQKRIIAAIEISVLSAIVELLSEAEVIIQSIQREEEAWSFELGSFLPPTYSLRIVKSSGHILQIG